MTRADDLPPDAGAAATSTAEILQQAAAWLADDPDPQTRPELRDLLSAAVGPSEGAVAGSAPDDADAASSAALAELRDRFRGPLEFGTAGLRGRLGAGPYRMNRVVVARAAAGLAAHLLGRGGRRVVIGYDARRNSATFARDSAAVLAGAGLDALVLPRPLPTPVLAFAIRHLDCDAGVMVTASHNPAADNGYKVYLGDGAQIAPPVDAQIAAEIAAAPSSAALPRGDGWRVLDDAVVAAYLDRAVSLLAPGGPRELRVAYTPLHGVGGELLLAAFDRAGFAAPSVVAAQAQPDPAFPTVPFPNPEEPGALDLALAEAAEVGADLVLANDPDADRCAVAVAHAGGFQILTGDEVGVLLGAHLLSRDPGDPGTSDETSDGTGARTGAKALAASVVSSALLRRIAGAAGVPYVETLTGFKWIARVDGLRYGYEEALGYCVDPPAVRDKDGITAALLVAELAAGLRAQGRTLLDRLDELAAAYGVHATGQLSVRVDDPAAIASTMARLRAAPPAALGGRVVEAVDDLRDGLGGLPPTDALRWRLAGDGRVIVRPSGTEPKLKCYLEVVVPVPDGDVDAARTLAEAALARLRHDVTLATG